MISHEWVFLSFMKFRKESEKNLFLSNEGKKVPFLKHIYIYIYIRVVRLKFILYLYEKYLW